MSARISQTAHVQTSTEFAVC